MLENIGVPLDARHYNALLSIHTQNEHSYDPLEFLKSMESKNIKPNQVNLKSIT